MNMAFIRGGGQLQQLWFFWFHDHFNHSTNFRKLVTFAIVCYVDDKWATAKKRSFWENLDEVRDPRSWRRQMKSFWEMSPFSWSKQHVHQGFPKSIQSSCAQPCRCFCDEPSNSWLSLGPTSWSLKLVGCNWGPPRWLGWFPHYKFHFGWNPFFLMAVKNLFCPISRQFPFL